jgi:t-SNARE complex subunit (syntaxin)
MADVEKAKQSANEIEARHRDIIKIEESIKELASMFADLARLVTAQVSININGYLFNICFFKGEMIDNIEHSVSKTLDYIGDTVKEMDQVEKSRKASVKVNNLFTKKT